MYIIVNKWKNGGAKDVLIAVSWCSCLQGHE